MVSQRVRNSHPTFRVSLRLRRKRSRGFTLIEMLVVLGIFAVLTSVILASHSRFGGVITLENLAYDTALSVRQAQLYGIAVRSYGSNNFNVGYGLHFDCNSVSPCNMSTYLLFADALNGNGIYDVGEIVTPPSPYVLNGGFRVSDICVVPAGGSTYNCGLNTLDILFKRPEPDAYIRANGASPLNDRAKIIVTSPQGNSASVLVEVSGQISVQ